LIRLPISLLIVFAVNFVFCNSGNAMNETDLFLQHVSSAVQQAWKLSSTSEPKSHKVQLRFSVQEDGKLNHLRMTESSSLSVNDMAALKAVQNASPFPSPPSGKACRLQADFEYDVASDTKQVKCEFRE
jgi:TonB family protein